MQRGMEDVNDYKVQHSKNEEKLPVFANFGALKTKTALMFKIGSGFSVTEGIT